MNTTLKTEVLIIGGGPVGMSMAAELRYQGIDCILIEKTDGVVRDPESQYRGISFDGILPSLGYFRKH